MPKYRWVVFKYPDGRTVRLVVEEQEFNPELIALQRSYGIKYRVGPRCNKDVAIALKTLGRQRRIVGKKVMAARPLSPDMGRGSGGPV